MFAFGCMFFSHRGLTTPRMYCARCIVPGFSWSTSAHGKMRLIFITTPGHLCSGSQNYFRPKEEQVSSGEGYFLLLCFPIYFTS
jgi:hypothetical protein